MTDLISRQAAIEEIQGFYPPKVVNETEAEAINRVGWECAINCIEAYLRTVKPIDPVKHGKWLHGREIAREMIDDTITAIIYEDWKCSDCGCTVEDGKPVWNYCPNCGAKMDGGGR